MIYASRDSAIRSSLAKLEVVGKIVVADAAHAQVATAKQTLYERGADYLLTVKENQKRLFDTLSTLFTEQRSSPSASRVRNPQPSELRLTGIGTLVQMWAIDQQA